MTSFASRRIWLFAMFAFLVSACRDSDTVPVSKDEAGLLPAMLQVPEFSLSDQRGSSFGMRDLRGKPWVATFFFTRCAATCPRQTATLARLQTELVGDSRLEQVMLVSISVDPTHDTPEVLDEYADQAGAESGRWRFLTGPRDDIWRLSTEGFRLAAGEDPGNAAMPMMHSPKLVLVDGRGFIRGFYDHDSDQAFTSLLADLRVLAQEPPPPDGG